ncbi:MAG: WD40/YVTN/BNR-like repeat-containing protein, partial [Kofleriaceae bacterium]
GVERTVSCGTCTGAEQCGAFSHGTCDELACTASKWCRTLAPTLAGNFDIRSIWAGPSEAWAIASNWTTPYEARLLHFDGVNWKLATTSSLPLSAVSSVGGDVWLSSRDGDIYKWINGALVIAGTSPYDWSSIATISSSDIWVVGSSTSERARASHFDGGAWTAVEFGDVFDSPWRFLSVSAVAWNAVWAVGYDGDDGSSSDTAAPLVGFYDGLQWTRQSNVPTTAFLRSVWARSATDVWAVGDDGVIVHYDGQTWSASPSGVTHDLLAVTGVGNTVWAAGANGVLLKRAGSSWVLQQTGTTRTIRALGAISATDVWAGGDDGLLLHYKP